MALHTKHPVFTIILLNMMGKKHNRESWGWWQGCLTRDLSSLLQA